MAGKLNHIQWLNKDNAKHKGHEKPDDEQFEDEPYIFGPIVVCWLSDKAS